MSAIRVPEHWTLTTLGKIGEYVNGRGFKKSEWSDHGRIIIRIQDLTGTRSNPNYFEGQVDPKHMVKSGDLLVSWAATLGVYVWRGPEAVLNQHIFKVRSHISPKFHYYLITSILNDLRRRTHGTGMVHITKRQFEQTEVVLPPNDVQVAIVDEIEKQFTRLDAALAALKRAQANVRRYRAAVLRSTFSKEALGPVRRVTGEELVSYVTSGSRGWARYYAPEGPLFIRIGNLQRGSITLDLNDVKHVRPPSDAEGQRTRVQPGDLLISITADLGMVARVPDEELQEMYVNQHVALARLADGIDGRYLAWFLVGPHGQAQLQSMRRGATKAGLGLDDIRALSVPIPTEIDQMAAVADLERKMTVADEVDSLVRANLRRASSARQAILARAFRGELLAHSTSP